MAWEEKFSRALACCNKLTLGPWPELASLWTFKTLLETNDEAQWWKQKNKEHYITHASFQYQPNNIFPADSEFFQFQRYDVIQKNEKKSKENGTEIYIYIYIYLELAYSKSLLVVEKTMRAISASQRVDSSWAFLKRPFLLFENVTCLAFMLSIFLIGIFFLAILILLYIQLHTFHNHAYIYTNSDPIYIDIRVQLPYYLLHQSLCKIWSKVLLCQQTIKIKATFGVIFSFEFYNF